MPRTSSRLSGGGGLRAGGTQQQQQQPGIQTFARATKPGVGAGALAPTKKALDQKRRPWRLRPCSTHRRRNGS